MKRKWAIWLSVGMLLLGLVVLLYPAISSAINDRHGSYAIQQMQEQLEGMDSTQLEAALEEARMHNERLLCAETAGDSRYDEILDFGNGIMGYITVEKLELMLPIYHGVSNEVLEKGVGHLPSSAFPIGGTGNHTVLTGHTGLPSARLFTDLEKLEPGDCFEVTIGSHSVYYQVDQMLVVLPQETGELMPVAGADYCTLVTCTPYGINSHRLLVRGKRVEMEQVDNPVLKIEETAPQHHGGRLLMLLLPAAVAFFAVKRKRGQHG